MCDCSNIRRKLQPTAFGMILFIFANLHVQGQWCLWKFKSNFWGVHAWVKKMKVIFEVSKWWPKETILNFKSQGATSQTPTFSVETIKTRFSDHRKPTQKPSSYLKLRDNGFSTMRYIINRWIETRRVNFYRMSVQALIAIHSSWAVGGSEPWLSGLLLGDGADRPYFTLLNRELPLIAPTEASFDRAPLLNPRFPLESLAHCLS